MLKLIIIILFRYSYIYVHSSFRERKCIAKWLVVF
jgi:hypothetical protein